MFFAKPLRLLFRTITTLGMHIPIPKHNLKALIK